MNKLANDLKNLGIKAGEIILMHSSLKSLGSKDVTPETVISALLEVLGERGTLLLPSLSYSEVNDGNPYFSVASTRCCVGAIPEYFRTRKGTVRSVHPTHSVCAVGRLANELTSRHIEDKTPVGPNSPFALLPKYGGKILMLGCGLKPNTSMHGVEESVGAPYCLNDFNTHYIIALSNGDILETDHRRHNFIGFPQHYERVAEITDSNDLVSGKVLNADCHLIDSPALWQKAAAAMKEDPYRFVDRI